MSTYILMKILESAPSRYDRGIRMLTFGALEPAYDRLVQRVHKGDRVLDIGCGTGALALRAARRGATVKGIDVNPAMLEIAQKRAEDTGLQERVEFCEMGAAELRGEAPEHYDVVMSGLCFSELSHNEIAFTLKQTHRILKAGGLLLIADEVRPANPVWRVFVTLLRIPLLAVTYLLTQTTSRAVRDLPERIAEAGFKIVSLRWNKMQNFLEIVAAKSEGAYK